MKRTLLVCVAISALLISPLNAARAADLPVKTPAPPAPAWSWTGFYVGIQGGGGWGTDADQITGVQGCAGGVCTPLVPVGFSQSSFGISGMFGGATAGYNWQTGPVVLGVEGDFSKSSISGIGDCFASFGLGGFFQTFATACKTTMDWFATADARLGATVDRALLYVKGGAAWAHFDHSAQVATFSLPPVASGSVSNTPIGFNFGTGIEYALWSGWSAKVEYDFMDFGNRTITMPLSVTAAPGVVAKESTSDHVTVNIVRAGLNFRFN